MDKIVVLPYDPKWENDFNEISNIIRNTLGDLIIGIEHVGSTAVKDLFSKPCIDIDVIIEDYSIFDRIISRLEGIGYLYEGDLGIKGREAFKCINKSNLQNHHLYVCPKDSLELKNHLKFRDYLRNNPDAVEKYSNIKLKASKLYPNNIDKYIEFKSSFIKEIYNICGLI